jgi:hypothetical protein
VQLLTGSSLVDFKIKLKTGITASNFDYGISLKNKTNSGELANASGSITITKDTPQPTNTLPIIAFTGATIGTGFITTNSVSTDIEVTDPDNDNISFEYSLYD